MLPLIIGALLYDELERQDQINNQIIARQNELAKQLQEQENRKTSTETPSPPITEQKKTLSIQEIQISYYRGYPRRNGEWTSRGWRR